MAEECYYCGSHANCTCNRCGVSVCEDCMIEDFCIECAVDEDIL